MSRPILSFKSVGLSRRWVAAIAVAKEIVAFSPFITRSAVTEALAKKGPACRLYTVVTVENYVSGGSNIACLRKLFDAKVQIYHIEDLHAKILLLPNELVTIGSQNMTAGGTANREASVVWKDESAAKETAQAVKAWMDAGKLLTDSVVRDLETSVASLRRQYRALREMTKKVTADIWDKWQQEEDRKRRAAEVAIASVWRRRQWNGFKTRCASEVIRGKVVPQGRGWSLSNKGPQPAPSYCQWQVDWSTEPVNLAIGAWRPCFHLDTRQWGKARVFREVISFIDRRISPKTFVIGGTNYRLSMACRQPSDDLSQFNLEIEAYHLQAEVRAKILGQYDISSMTADKILPCKPGDEDFEPELFEQVVDAINTNENEIQAQLLRIILGPRRKRSLWVDHRIDRFFLPNETIYTSLRVVDRSCVLVFSKSRAKAAGETGSKSLFD